MARPPGFLDEPPLVRPSPIETPFVEPPPRAPVLLEPAADAATGRIAPDWAPRLVLRRRRRAGTLASIGAGLALLGASWIGLSAVRFVEAQFARGDGLGWVALVLFAAALALILRGGMGEARAWRALHRVEALRAALDGAAPSLEPVRHASRAWLHAVGRRLPDPEAVALRIAAAGSVAELRAVLREQVAEVLRGQARRAGRRAAIEGGAMVAITPSPVLEGVLAGVRGVALIREVAQLYGVRPGLFATLALVRRVAWTAAGVSGLDLLSQSLADHTLRTLPLVRHLAGAVPGTSLAAMRLYRLADMTAEACSPVSVAPGEPEG
jgi:putative membrane protein